MVIGNLHGEGAREQERGNRARCGNDVEGRKEGRKKGKASEAGAARSIDRSNEGGATQIASPPGGREVSPRTRTESEICMRNPSARLERTHSTFAPIVSRGKVPPWEGRGAARRHLRPVAILLSRLYNVLLCVLQRSRSFSASEALLRSTLSFT